MMNPTPIRENDPRTTPPKLPPRQNARARPAVVEQPRKTVPAIEMPRPSIAPPQVVLPAERFRCSEEWNEQRMRGVAMYCSDGRWGDAFDEFCHRSLQMPRYDRFAVPGGPAWLTVGHEQRSTQIRSAGAELEHSLSQAAWAQLDLLVQKHQLQRIVLITHYGCAFYAERLGKNADGCLPIQLQDLQHARDAAKSRFPRLTVEIYLAMQQENRLTFHGVM